MKCNLHLLFCDGLEIYLVVDFVNVLQLKQKMRLYASKSHTYLAIAVVFNLSWYQGLSSHRMTRIVIHGYCKKINTKMKFQETQFHNCVSWNFIFVFFDNNVYITWLCVFSVTHSSSFVSYLNKLLLQINITLKDVYNNFS